MDFLHRFKDKLSILTLFVMAFGQLGSFMISVTLSGLLFWSLSNLFFFQVLLVCMAVIIEIGKYLCVGILHSDKDSHSKALIHVFLAGATILSLLGSVGGFKMNADNGYRAALNEYEQQYDLLDMKQNGLQDRHDQNKEMIRNYTALNLIEIKAQPLQKQQKAIEDEIEQILLQKGQLKKPELSATAAFIAAITSAFTFLKPYTGLLETSLFVFIALMIETAGFLFFHALCRTLQAFGSKAEDQPLDVLEYDQGINDQDFKDQPTSSEVQSIFSSTEDLQSYLAVEQELKSKQRKPHDAHELAKWFRLDPPIAEKYFKMLYA